MLLILAGSYFVVDTVAARSDRSAFGQFVRTAFGQFVRTGGVPFRFAALAVSATEAVFLKRALLASTPLTTFAMWSVLGLPIAAIVSAVLLRGRVRAELVVLTRHPRTYVSLALATGIMQLTTIVTFGRLQVGYSLALFQLSALLSVFLGYRYFQERDIRKRLLGAAVMVTGAAIIVTFGKP
jgi:drug/metabolite transporter (DMT)-like permease